MNTIILGTKEEESWEMELEDIPRIGERMIIDDKLYVIGNITWVIKNGIKCNIFVLAL